MSDENVPVSEDAELPAPEDTTELEHTLSDTEAAPDIEQLRIFLHDADVETIIKAYEKRLEILGEDEMAARQARPGTYENLLYSAGEQQSVEAVRTLKSLGRIQDLSKLTQNLAGEDGKSILSTFMRARRASGKGKMLTGREARVEFAIKSGRAKRVALYNSGFHIDLENPRLTSLNDFFTRAYVETVQYGREFGASFFFFNDLLIKEAVVDLIIQHCMGSSMSHWNRGNNLSRYITLLDLKVILTTLSSLMFQNGFNFHHVCKNPSGHCTHSEEALIDISKFVLQDYTKLSSEAIEHMKCLENVSIEAVEKYQALVNASKHIRIGNVGIALKVPSLAEYLEYGKKFNAELTKSNFADDGVDIYRSLAYSYYKVYTPFVESLSLYDHNDEIDIVTKDQEVIADELGRLQDSDLERQFIKQIDEYIADTEISKICYPAVPCPSCGYAGEDSHGYYSVDPENTFFTLSLKKLAPT